MSNHDWWLTTRADLLPLVARLAPEDALMAVRAAVREPNSRHALATLAGVIRGLVARADDEQRRRRTQGNR